MWHHSEKSCFLTLDLGLELEAGSRGENEDARRFGLPVRRGDSFEMGLLSEWSGRRVVNAERKGSRFCSGQRGDAADVGIGRVLWSERGGDKAGSGRSGA